MLSSRLVRNIEMVVFSAVMFAAALPGAAAPVQKPQTKLKAYKTKYYVIYTDLDVDTAREAAARMTAMAEEYHRRTKGFAGTIRKRLPFYLFSNAEDYHAAGAPGGSTGVYTGRRLMVVATKSRGEGVWRTVQHEGFHQFAHVVIRGSLPVWVNEGLAKYFGQGVWTGDGFVTGLISPGQLRRVKSQISAGKMLPLAEMLSMTRKKWNEKLDIRNYDQAWSLVHFLAHADDGKYREAFSDFINDISKGRAYKAAFMRRFGRDIGMFQARYTEWWATLPDNPTADLYTKAVVQTLTGYLARAYSQEQSFETAEEFFEAAREKKLKYAREQWLPPTLLDRAVGQSAKLKEWSLGGAKGARELKLARPDGTVFVGTFTLKSGTVDTVVVRIVRPAPQADSPSTDARKELR